MKEKKTKSSNNNQSSNDIPNYVKYHETEKGGIMLQCTKRRGKLLEELISKYPCENDMIDVGICMKIPRDILLTSASASSSS